MVCSIAANISVVLTLLLVPCMDAIARFEESLPDITQDDFRLLQSVRITDRSGNEIYRTYKDEDRFFQPLREIPDVIKHAVIAIEDERFYKRSCIDFRALMRAAYSTYILDDRQGGSTITQQLVRSITNERDITVQRKIREIILACRLEAHIGKDAILEQYLNRVNFGGTRYGIESASQAFFGIPARWIDAPRAAILAAVIQKPSYYASGGRMKEVPDRAQEVLQSMLRLRLIGVDTFDTAMQDLQSISFKLPDPSHATPYQFVSLILNRAQRVLAEKGEEDALTYSGVTIMTTLDPHVQRTAEEVIETIFPPIAEQFNARDVAAVIIDRQTRDVLGYVGNVDWGGNQGSYWVDMAAAPRQMGSAFKPIVYASYMENGKTPDTIISDWHITIGGIKPKNFEGGFMGRMTIRKALAYSRNIPAIRAFLEVGEDRVIQLASAMGASTPLIERERRRESNPRFSFGWPMAIGSAEMPLYELVQAYGTIAEGGVADATQTITNIETSEGIRLYEPPETARWQILHPESADAVADILSDWTARPERWNEVIDLPHEWPVGLKTGTSNVCRARKIDGNCKSYGVLNTVAVGFTNNYVIGVLVTNADNALLDPKADGLTVAVPIWTAIIRALAGHPYHS
jgi:penicillin-binding protein 1A